MSDELDAVAANALVMRMIGQDNEDMTSDLARMAHAFASAVEVELPARERDARAAMLDELLERRPTPAPGDDTTS